MVSIINCFAGFQQKLPYIDLSYIHLYLVSSVTCDMVLLQCFSFLSPPHSFLSLHSLPPFSPSLLSLPPSFPSLLSLLSLPPLPPSSPSRLPLPPSSPSLLSLPPPSPSLLSLPPLPPSSPSSPSLPPLSPSLLFLSLTSVPPLCVQDGGKPTVCKYNHVAMVTM